MGGDVKRPAFLYWGRRGPITALARTMVDAARADGIDCLLSLSSYNPRVADFRDLGESLAPIRAFRTRVGALLGLAWMGGDQRRLLAALRHHRADAVINLMPHVWSPLVAPRIRDLGIPYATVIHDAIPHPGDPTGLVNRWLLEDARHADVVFTLSNATANALSAKAGWKGRRIVPLFHPDLVYGSAAPAGEAHPRRLKVLFFGRLLPYKGLDIFADALAVLADRGQPVTASVVGEGAISAATRQTLLRLGVQIENRWIADHEVSALFDAHDIVAATHVEASQSGVIATAFAHGKPVVVTPVGGLVEQVENERNGVIAAAATGEAVAEAIGRIACDAELRRAMALAIRATASGRSPGTFLRRMLDVLSGVPPRSP